MGPHTPLAKRGVSIRADAHRGRLRSMEERPLIPIGPVEWASPTSIRARSRPSNLHSYLRSNAPLSLSTVVSPRPFQRGGSASSSSTNGASPCQSQRDRIRSMSTRATQTSPTDFFVDAESKTATISLGAYGDVSHMDIDTISFLIETLEERRSVLLRQNHGAADRSFGATGDPMRILHNVVQHNQRYWNETTGDGGDNGDDADDAEERTPPSKLVRSRSYEALAKLEQILEARHQQLMNDGALEGPLSLHGSPGASSLSEEIRKLQQSFLQEARGAE